MRRRWEKMGTHTHPQRKCNRNGAPVPSIRIERILVPIDFTRDSLKPLSYAAAMAKTHRAKIILIHAATPIHFRCDYGYGPVERCGDNEAIIKNCRTRLQRLARTHLAPKSLAQVLVKSGKPSEEIIQAAKDVMADLILLYAHPERQNEHIHSHDTMEHVARSAPCPVMVVRAHQHEISNPLSSI
jgi:nucleotide-binding universal stress UspA family protein